jgi:hypothetical protein
MYIYRKWRSGKYICSVRIAIFENKQSQNQINIIHRMNHCEFIYARATSGHSRRDRCENEAKTRSKFCPLHRDCMCVQRSQSDGSSNSRCAFVYQRTRGSHSKGKRCERKASHVNNTLCQEHRCSQQSITSSQSLEMSGDPFPRFYSDEEQRQWVDEAWKRTSPTENQRKACLICGRLYPREELISVTESELIQKREILTASIDYPDVDKERFQYGGGY